MSNEKNSPTYCEQTLEKEKKLSLDDISTNISAVNKKVTDKTKTDTSTTDTQTNDTEPSNQSSNNSQSSNQLFTIDGISFDSPVYSVFDYINYEYYIPCNMQSYNHYIYFVCEKGCLLHFVFDTRLYLSSSSQKMIITINDSIVYKQDISSLSGYNVIHSEFNFVSNTTSNKIKIYIEPFSNEYHFYSKISLYGKNVCFLTRKSKYKVSPSIDDTYIFTKTKSTYAQYQIASYDNLDFENGWQYVPNYTSHRGSNHQYLQSYIFDQTLNKYCLDSEMLVYQDYSLNPGSGKLIRNLQNNSSSSTSNSLSNLGFQKGYYKNEACITFPSYNTNNISFYFYYTASKTNVNYSINLSNNTLNERYVVDSVVPISYLNFLSNTFIPVLIVVDNFGYAYLVDAYTKNKITELGFGTQPFAIYDENDIETIYVYLNCFGTIIEKEYKLTTNQSATLKSQKIIDFGEAIIMGKNGEYFLQLNDALYKKQLN